MDRWDRRAVLAAVADELEAESYDGVLDAGDLRALCWRAIARSSGDPADRDRACAAAATGLRDEVLRVYAGMCDVLPRRWYRIDGLRDVVAGMRGRQTEWYR